MNEQTVQKTSSELISRYLAQDDCLTAHLMLECSEVLAGVKPANLVSLVNRTRPCGRNLYQLWLELQQSIRKRLHPLEFLVLDTKEKSVLLLCFHRGQLDLHLRHSGIRTLLHKTGYSRTASLDNLLHELRERVQQHDGFPHEIGLFIGYPPKDVAAFMGLVALPFTCQALWKIYGNPAQSLLLAENFRYCRECMNRFLTTTTRPLPCTVQELDLFHQNNDNNIHFH